MKPSWNRAALAALVVGAAGLVPLGSWATTSAGAASTTSSNLLVGDTASLLNGLGSWVGKQASISRPSSGVLAIRSGSTSWAGALSGTQVTGTAASAGSVYSGTLAGRAWAKGRTVAPVLQFLASDGRVLAKTIGQGFDDSSSVWTTSRPVVGIAPVGTAVVVLGEMVWSPNVGEVHLLRSPVLTRLGSPARDVVGPLTTSGNKIYDATGPVVLRGIHRRGLEEPSTVPAISASELDHAKRWGATMIRVSVASPYWLPGNCNYRSDYAAQVDQAVAAVTARKMVALVDLHENTTLSCGTVAQQPMADVTAIDFWRQVAARYRSNPLVAFDLYNEPHDISDDVWLRGGRVTTGMTVYQAAGMQQMYDAVRSAGASNLVVVSGRDWANYVPMTLQGYNIAYAAHVYTCTVSTDPRKCASNPTDPSPILNNYAALGESVPVIVTEFGWPSVYDGQFVANVISYARDHGWGWIAYAWDGNSNGLFSLVATTETYEPTVPGQSVLAGLRGPTS